MWYQQVYDRLQSNNLAYLFDVVSADDNRFVWLALFRFQVEQGLIVVSNSSIRLLLHSPAGQHGGNAIYRPSVRPSTEPS